MRSHMCVKSRKACRKNRSLSRRSPAAATKTSSISHARSKTRASASFCEMNMIDINPLQQLLAQVNPSTSLGVKRGRPLFMAHMIAGYPNMEQSEKVATALADGGANIIEVQIPFSDPMAD